jgi:hypothetical protein
MPDFMKDTLEKGGPGVALIVAIYIFVIMPMNNRFSTVVDELNREVVPAVNLLLQKEGLQTPQLRDLGAPKANGDVTLESAKVVGVDQQAGRVFVFVPALRRFVAVTMQISPDTRITDAQGNVIPISEIKQGQSISVTLSGKQSSKGIPTAASVMLLMR